MIVLKQHRIFRSDLKNNPEVLYLFGDNLTRIGLGGQAAEMRGEPNAFGIATKKDSLYNHPTSYFQDNAETKRIILNELSKLAHKIEHEKWDIIIIPSDGIGTGLAKMQQYCPNALAFLNGMLNSLGGE